MGNDTQLVLVKDRSSYAMFPAFQTDEHSGVLGVCLGCGLEGFDAIPAMGCGKNLYIEAMRNLKNEPPK